MTFAFARQGRCCCGGGGTGARTACLSPFGGPSGAFRSRARPRCCFCFCLPPLLLSPRAVETPRFHMLSRPTQVIADLDRHQSSGHAARCCCCCGCEAAEAAAAASARCLCWRCRATTALHNTSRSGPHTCIATTIQYAAATEAGAAAEPLLPLLPLLHALAWWHRHRSLRN